jgi:hypothetical protein
MGGPGWEARALRGISDFTLCGTNILTVTSQISGVHILLFIDGKRKISQLNISMKYAVAVWNGRCGEKDPIFAPLPVSGLWIFWIDDPVQLGQSHECLPCYLLPVTWSTWECKLVQPL